MQLEDTEKAASTNELYDMMLIDRVLHTKADPRTYLSNAANLLRPDGFVIINEVTDCLEVHFIICILTLVELRVYFSHGFQLQLALLALKGKPAPAPDDAQRKFGVFYTRRQWETLFEEAGMQVVALRAAAPNAMLSSWLLRRRQTLPAPPATATLAVDDGQNFDWLQPLQRAVDDDAKQRLWLTATDARDTGAVGLALCLKAELSKNSVR